MEKKSLEELAREHGEAEREAAERTKANEDAARAKRQQEETEQKAFDAALKTFCIRANRAVENNCKTLTDAGMNANPGKYRFGDPNAGSLPVEPGSNKYTWLCFVEVTLPMTSRIKNKVKQRPGQSRIIFKAGFTHQAGSRTVMSFVELRSSEHVGPRTTFDIMGSQPSIEELTAVLKSDLEEVLS